jgi:hypothetical protein
MTGHRQEFLNQLRESQHFSRDWFCTLVSLGLSDTVWLEKTQRVNLVEWLTDVFEEVKSWAPLPVHAAFVSRTLHVELGHALMKYCQEKTTDWNSESELEKMGEMGKCLTALGDDADLVYFLTMPKDLPKELSVEGIVDATERWHKMTAPSMRAKGMTWEVLDAGQTFSASFIGSREMFWWEAVKKVPEEQARVWITALGVKDVIPSTPMTCLKSLGSAILASDNTLPFYSQIKDWKDTPEASQKALRKGRPSKKGLGLQTPTWTAKELLSAKRMVWHAECLSPSYAQSLPLFEPYFVIPNEFWERYAEKDPHPAWAKIMMPWEWLARIAAVGSVDGGWRNSPGNILALETDTRLRLATRHAEVDEAVQAILLKMGAPAARLSASTNQTDHASIAQSHWERMRLEWKHGKALKSAGPAL